jgi:peptidyl serine alpha-galactosyltransferase
MAHLGSSLRMHQNVRGVPGQRKTLGGSCRAILSTLTILGGVYVLILLWMHAMHAELNLEAQAFQSFGPYGSEKFSALANFASEFIEESSTIAYEVYDEIQEEFKHFDPDLHSYTVNLDWLNWKADSEASNDVGGDDVSLVLASNALQHSDDDEIIAAEASDIESSVDDDVPDDDNVVREVDGVVSGHNLGGSDASDDDNDKNLHILFSTDCSFYQDWQSLVLFHSAYSAGQKGHITRVASGCDDKAQFELLNLYARLWPATRTGGWIYTVHFTPDFKKDKDTGKKYDFYNKPYGMQHWMNAHKSASSNTVSDNTVVAIIDPDFLFLRPLTSMVDESDHVRPGRPAGQLYGLQAPWASERNRDTTLRTKKGDNNYFDVKDICGEGSPCFDVSVGEGIAHYAIGPPYIIHVKDFGRLVNTWVEMVPKVYKGYPHLLAEMYAYCLAAAHQNLPHTTLVQHMVSNVNVDAKAEGWAGIDALGDDVCTLQNKLNSTAGTTTSSLSSLAKTMPTFIHYCQFYRAGEIGFKKRRFHKKYFECNSPLLLEPPENLGSVRYKNRDGEIVKYNAQEARRNAFMLCALHRGINEAVLDAKTMVCSAGGDEKGMRQHVRDNGDLSDVVNTTRSVNLAVNWQR